MSNLNHEEQVAEFFSHLKKQDPAHWAEMCEKYPTLSPNRIRRLRRRERCVGLLGLQPVALPAATLAKYNMDGVYEE
jgi:hypothetical protein